MQLDPAIVALRHYSKQAAGTAEDITRHLPDFERAKQDYVTALRDWDEKMKKLERLGETPLPKDPYLRRLANRPWLKLLQNGFRIAEGILSTRSIPRKDAKGLEMAYRLMGNSRRMPKDPLKWWKINEKRIDLLIRAARTWPEKEEGTDELFTLGSFRVHNTVGAEGAELDSLKKAIERVEKASRKNPVPGFAKTVYGDIQVVSRIRKGHHAAWYNIGDDSLYIRRTKSTGMDEVNAIIHELAHRYWSKFAPKDKKRAWQRHHWAIDGKIPGFREGMTMGFVDMPEVGDLAPVKIKGVKGQPTVVEKAGGLYFFEVPVGDKMQTLTVSYREIYRVLASNKHRNTSYPTAYASTDAEEHFAEALALKALGSLGAEHEVPFDNIWE